MPESSKKTFIIDIGSHKMEELYLFFKPTLLQSFILFKWSIKESIRSLLQRDISRMKRCLKTNILFYKKRANLLRKKINIISVEPNHNICFEKLKFWNNLEFFTYYPLAILGHDMKRNLELVNLRMYEDSISSSLYNKKGIKLVSKSSCIGLNFNLFIDLLINKHKIKPSDSIVLRVNCEGSEMAIIRTIISRKLNVSMIIGSLADVKKIHGKKLYEEMIQNIQDNNIRYLYLLGSNPKTWVSTLSDKYFSSLIYE